MKRSTKTMIILMATIMVMILTAAPVSASSMNTYAKIKDGNNDAKATTLNMTQKKGYGYEACVAGSSKATWKSSNTSVATVTSGGVVKAKKAGKATITLTVGKEKDTVTVTVKPIKMQECYDQLNKYRKASKAKALKKDKNLEKIAQIRAKEMALHNKFSHTRPNGKSGLTLIKGNIYKGENIAKGQTSSIEVSKAWYNSKGHRKNMLKKQYKKVGIAYYQYNGVIYWAQVFSS